MIDRRAIATSQTLDRTARWRSRMGLQRATSNGDYFAAGVAGPISGKGRITTGHD